MPSQSFKPNPFGLYGMAGGVAEWVADLALRGEGPEAGPISRVLSFTPSALNTDAETAELTKPPEDPTPDKS